MERPESNPPKKPRSARCVGLIAVAFLLACPSAMGQSSSQALSSLPSAEQVLNRNQDPFAGSIPQAKATAETIELTIEDALQRGLKYNLGLYLADRVTQQSRASRLRALSDMLPVVNGSFAEEEEKLNLKALGLSAAVFPGIPGSVGPFGISDLRATGSWNAIDLHTIDNVRAASQNVKAAQFTYRDARDTVVLAVGANYLLTIANESRVEATEAELKTAQALYQLAADQEAAGLAPNIDTLRARVQLQAQQEALIAAQNELEKQRIALARVIGLPVGQKFNLVNRVPYHPLPEMELQNAYARALQTRPDYQAALAALRAAQLSREAAWKQRLPSIGFAGEYGVLGTTPDSMSPNWTAAATLTIPIFQGGKVEADVQQTDAVLKQRQAQVDDMRGRIEQDIEDAILDLKAAGQQVEVAKLGLGYAQQALGQSQDRFAAGVTNNVEVIQAQQQLASANDRYISSLYAHNIAKVLLARAIGNAEQAVQQYLAAPGSVLPPNGTGNPESTGNPSETKLNVAPGPGGMAGAVSASPPRQKVAPPGEENPVIAPQNTGNNSAPSATVPHE
ncbi:MAG: TolC family protein [Candidatus Korobacteraceae bacterium]|jgi:outer membrane protein TolC